MRSSTLVTAVGGFLIGATLGLGWCGAFRTPPEVLEVPRTEENMLQYRTYRKLQKKLALIELTYSESCAYNYFENKFKNIKW